MSEEREILTYQMFGTAMRELAQTVIDDYRPDVVLSIARGGLLIGGALGYALGIKNVSVINVEFYTDVDQRLEQPVMLPPTPEAVDLTGMKVLIADDVADTGGTLRLVQEYCAAHVAESRTAVIYEKPHSVITPDYSWRTTDRWIDFPWSNQPPVTPR
ncbi:phosphoribosyltransferase [Corynebacterium bovis]|uniref:phosphoribosyltransferase n=1 Tax=Corynebacterium bovis TaxID=36808 RepID=UPI000F65056E|nr:phosphoribosyltransferase family protein [Corynebacterium bovis]RRO81812.1 phosphoribosyltransferase [Corynebacterium bovis]RRO92627.1 phosphoribosyltransferase [Corynebacterium bovis]